MAESEEQGLVSKVGPVEIDWLRSVGYFGGIALAVAFEIIEPPLGLFIAAIPFSKFLAVPNAPKPIRSVSEVLQGAAKPVGGDIEATIRVAKSSSRSRDTAYAAK